MNDARGKPGVMKTITGQYVDVGNASTDTIDIADVAWGLGRIIRFNGHITADYTVAHHCLLMSHYVEREFALEALLHDAAEAYMGDIIYPVKALLDEQTDGLASRLENRLLAVVIDALAPEGHKIREHIKDGEYRKSPAIRQADIDLVQHEWAMCDRGDEYEPNPAVEHVIKQVTEQYHELFLTDGQPWWAYLKRYHDLVGTEFDFDYYVGAYGMGQPSGVDLDKAMYEQYNEMRVQEGHHALSEEEWEELMAEADQMMEEYKIFQKEAAND